MPENTNQLLEACARHTLSEEFATNNRVVIREAYIPYIPPQWNGYLVLAEAQNLANSNDDYVQWLKSLSPQERMNRFGERMNRFGDGLAVGPWDDGSLPCAIAAAFARETAQCAVSNAVPWSQTKPDGTNENPSEEMKDQAVRFWEDLLSLLLIRPTHIITAGNVAEEVLERADPESRYCRKNVRLPSPQAMAEYPECLM